MYIHLHALIHQHVSPKLTLQPGWLLLLIAYSYQLYNTVDNYLCNGWPTIWHQRTCTMGYTSKYHQIHRYTHSNNDVPNWWGIAVDITPQYVNASTWWHWCSTNFIHQQCQMDIEWHNIWIPIVSNQLKHIILWFQSCGHTFSKFSNASALCSETLCI